MMTVTKGRRRIVIIGGGITGLTATYYLQRAAIAKQLPIDITLVEASLRLGGKVHTHRKNGIIVEKGPESFFDRTGSVQQLAQDLHIEDSIVGNHLGPTYVALGNELYPVPESLLAGDAPHISSFITSRLFSVSGKVRAAGDFVIPRTHLPVDQPVGPFLRRRFGAEIVENLVEPLLASVYAGDVEQLSLQTTFPELYDVEQKHRSLLLGMRKAQSSLFYGDVPEQAEGIFHTFKNGLETMVEAMEATLKPGTILKGVRAEAIAYNANKEMTVQLSHKPIMQADDIIIATPYHVAQGLFADKQMLQELDDMTAATIATVNMVFKREQFADLKALAFFVSRNSDLTITSCTWSNLKWPTTAPQDYVVLRSYIGRVGDEAIVELSDREIEQNVLADLQQTLGVSGKPLTTIVTRWKDAMPQYTVGHKARIARVEQKLHEIYPNVHLAGSSFKGISIPECVAQGQQIAAQLLAPYEQQLSCK